MTGDVRETREVREVRRCACGAVKLGDDVVHGERECRPIQREVPVVAEYPAPVVTSRDPWDGAGTPSAVAGLAQRAVAASWTVRVQRSRGCRPHASHGAPGALKWLYGVVLSNGEASGYAIHDGSTWVSVLIWGRDRPWFPGASVTDLGEWIAARGVMPESWYQAIREREQGKDARAKARVACNRGSHPLAVSHGAMMHCPACDNSWAVGSLSWRKTNAGSGEAL